MMWSHQSYSSWKFLFLLFIALSYVVMFKLTTIYQVYVIITLRNDEISFHKIVFEY
jgi:hypothetical protein